MAADPPRGWIVDTNVLSRSHDATARASVAQWLSDNAALIRISVITVAEMRRGLMLARARIERQHDPRVRRRDTTLLDAKSAWYEQLKTQFAARILPIDAAVAERWADVSVRFPSIRDGDKAIVATALIHGCGVATRNLRDFRAASLPLVDPFDPASW